MNRFILAAISDTHGGFKLGLLNPKTILEDEDEEGNIIQYSPELNNTQKYLWDDVYLPAVDKLKELAGDDEIILAHIGDPTHGNKYISEQVSTRLSDQIDIALFNLLPLCQLDNVSTIRIVKGTGSHEFGEGSAPILIQRLLSKAFPNKSIKAVNHGLMEIDGFEVDYAHHGPYPGSRDWLRGNVARYYLRDLMYQSINSGMRPPNLVLRGHYHQYVREWLSMNGNESWLVILPSMCMLSFYTRQATRSAFRSTNGLVAFEVEDGQLREAHFFGKTMDIRTKETIR